MQSSNSSCRKSVLVFGVHTSFSVCEQQRLRGRTDDRCLGGRVGEQLGGRAPAVRYKSRALACAA